MEDQTVEQTLLSQFHDLSITQDELPEREKTESITESPRSLHELEEIIGYKFNNPSLLEEAFTHRSYKKGCVSYERLEFIGDSVLGLLMAKELSFLYPDLMPGMLTKLRSANVSTEKLSRVAMKYGLHRFLRHRNPLFASQIEDLREGMNEYPLHSVGLIVAPKVLADIVESTIGAIFGDSDSCLDTTWKVVKELLQPMITPGTLQTQPAAKLNELCQKYGFVKRTVDFWEVTRECDIFVNNEFCGRGQCRAKKEIAMNRAAHKAYLELSRKMGSENSDTQQD